MLGLVKECVRCEVSLVVIKPQIFGNRYIEINNFDPIIIPSFDNTSKIITNLYLLNL